MPFKSKEDTTSPPKGRLRNATPKGSTKTSESPEDKDCTATVTLDTEIPIIITKSECKTASVGGDNSSLFCGADLFGQK